MQSNVINKVQVYQNHFSSITPQDTYFMLDFKVLKCTASKMNRH